MRERKKKKGGEGRRGEKDKERRGGKKRVGEQWGKKGRGGESKNEKRDIFSNF